MAVVKDSVYFVKKSFSGGKYLGEYDGVELIFEENAFSTFNALIDYITDGESASVSILDSSLSITKTIAAGLIGKIQTSEYIGDGSAYTAKGKLNITADVAADFSLFDSITVSGAEVVGNIRGGSVSAKGVFSAKGTLKAADANVAGDILNFKTISIVNSSVDGVIEGKLSSLTFKVDKKADSAADYSIGAVNGFQNVTLNGIKDKNITKGIQVGAVTGGTLDKVGNAVVIGTLKATNGVVIDGDVSGYKTVALTNSAAGNVIGSENGKSEGVFTFKVDKNADAAVEYKAGNVSGFLNVTLNGIKDKNITKGIQVGDVSGGILDKSGNTVVGGALKATNGVIIDGDVSGYKTVALTNSAAGNVTGSENGKSEGAFTFKVDKNADAAVEYKAGNVSGFLNVTLNGINNKNMIKGIQVGAVAGGTLDKSGNAIVGGALKAANGVVIDGEISGYKTVALIYAEAASVDCWGAKGSALNMSNAFVSGAVTGVQKVNVQKGANAFENYVGTNDNDTLTVAKNSVLAVDGTLDFGEGAKDKLVLNGTLVVGSSFYVSELESISGSGEIAADTVALAAAKSQFELPAKSKIKFVDLGETSENFCGSVYETGDNTQRKAYKWENTAFAYNGWLSNSTDVVDDVDYFKLSFPAAEGTKFKFTAAEGVTLNYGGNDYVNGDEFTMASKDDLFKVTIGEDVISSVAYSVEKIA